MMKTTFTATLNKLCIIFLFGILLNCSKNGIDEINKVKAIESSTTFSNEISLKKNV